MSEDQALNELETVLGERPAAIEAAGLKITPVTLERLPAFARAARPVFDAVRNMDTTVGGDVLFDLLENHTDEIAALLAVGADVDLDSLRTRPLGEVYEIGLAVFRANEDFFIRRLLPLLTQAARRVPGPTSSSGSSAQDSA